jgi:hypothetical protein
MEMCYPDSSFADEATTGLGEVWHLHFQAIGEPAEANRFQLSKPLKVFHEGQKECGFSKK